VRRREFIAALGGAAAWPLVGSAQQPTMPRVGYVWIGPRGTDVNVGERLRRGFLDEGYVIGRDLAFEERYADGDAERIPALIAELLALNVDVLVTPGLLITRAAKRATSSVPIVCVTGDPVALGLVASLSRPGGNITGLSLLSNDYSAKWPELLKEAVRKLDRVAVLCWNPDNPAMVNEVENIKETARALGLDLAVFLVTPKEIDGSFAAIADDGFTGLVVTTDPSIEPLTPQIIAFAAKHRLPAIYPFSKAVEQGGLMSYSADFFAIFRRAATFVDSILKGARPADLPIEQATTVLLKINMKTAKALDLNVPPSLLARADEVIE
jgi:putative tryptophan/tyrosine transport system substrate-binding protein